MQACVYPDDGRQYIFAMSTPKSVNPWLHRYVCLVVVLTAVLIYAGGLVTTIGAGLAVPDWPLSFGSLNPAGWWKTPMVREEHGHRLIGATIGFLTVLLCAWVIHARLPKPTRSLAIAAVVMVIIQGVLGGLRVIDKNLTYAIIHACFGQAFFCVLVCLAWVTSPDWGQRPTQSYRGHSLDFTVAASAFAAVAVQLMIGAIMRHHGAGLAIPTFPLVFDGLMPHRWDFGITIHYIHRVWAIVVCAVVLALFARCMGAVPYWARLAASTSLGLVIVQLIMGGAIIVTGRAILPTTLHVLVGACLLATTLSATLWLAPRSTA